VPADGDPALVIVTGGARGIGQSITESFLANGWRVAVIDVNPKAVAAISASPPAAEGRLLAAHISILDRPAVQSFVDELLDRHGKIAALVNNAGMTLPATFLDQNDEDWDRIVGVNLKGTFVISQVVARSMVVAGSGAIVNISSISAHGVRTGPPAYAAAKVGVEGLSRLMAVQLGPAGIRVNTVVVGTTATPWLLGRKSDAEIDDMRATTLSGRIGEPDDVAEVVRFLCSDPARHVTGQLVSVSGGQWVP
jgi:3-oxoacyl-[acyl-carrier protein] reductase